MTEPRTGPGNRHRDCDSRGFTLIEVLVALTVLAITLGPLLQVYSRSTGNVRTADLYVRASAVADSLLASAGPETALEPTQISGTAAEIFDWTLTIRPYRPELSENLALELVEVEVVVTWWGGTRYRNLTHTTLQLADRTTP